MSDRSQQDRSQVALSRRKAQDRSIVLILAGLLLLLPPVGAAALLDMQVFGLPLPLVYVFTVWAGLIGLGAALARPLREYGEANAAADTPPPGN